MLRRAIKDEINSAIPDLNPTASFITFQQRPEHCPPDADTACGVLGDVPCGILSRRRCAQATKSARARLLMWGIARVAAMLWIYWDTFWSLFFSAVWFMTIVSHPDTEITG
jgi:hypothetical protein